MINPEDIDKASDSDLLDFLQKLNNKSFYTGRCVLRMSSNGRGWRLHETETRGHKNVREAIKEFIKDTLRDME